jgi:hypothetical protein
MRLQPIVSQDTGWNPSSKSSSGGRWAPGLTPEPNIQYVPLSYSLLNEDGPSSKEGLNR